MRLKYLVFLLLSIVWTGCRTVPSKEPVSQASRQLKLARSLRLPVQTRAGAYLEAASLAAPNLADPKNDKARSVYNTAAAELTDLLQEHPEFWNRPLMLPTSSGSCGLQFKAAGEKGLWSPSYFTDFIPAYKVKTGPFRKHLTEEGVGGALVGIHRSRQPRRDFQFSHGQVAPVTATLDFTGQKATLALWDPAIQSKSRIKGSQFPLAADFTAPVATLPRRNELWTGFMAMVDAEKYLQKTGLYMIGPYHPDRIPVVLVHGLMSTPQMWANVMNELEGDPELRGRFQFWIFRYPTGNPVAYSALRCRQEFARFEKLYPNSKGYILVGHSMGGLVSRMQATNTGRALWDGNFKEHAERYYQKLPPDNLLKQALVFEANPKVKRIVFVCVPHRGSGLALGSIGAFGMKLIRLPSTLVTTIATSLGEALETVGGKINITSIDGLSPRNPTLLAMDKLPVSVPYHSIVGDRGKGNGPKSSDGVVPYWSSHLEGAQSELTVPGPHGSYELPETVAELKRILLLHRDKNL